MNDDQRFRQIFLMLDSDQAGERESALGRLHALRPQAHWPSFRTVLEASEGKVAGPSENERKLAQENADLRAENERLRAKIARTKELFGLRDAAMVRRRAGGARWLRTAALATIFFLAMGFRWEPAEFTREASAFVTTGVDSLFASIH